MRIEALALLAAGATFGCENSFAPEIPTLGGPWRGTIEVSENGCTGNTENDVQTWLITQSGEMISIFFSHQEYRFETARSARSPDGALQVEATIAGESRSGDRLVATEVVERRTGETTCRIVRTYTMERFGT